MARPPPSTARMPRPAFGARLSGRLRQTLRSGSPLMLVMDMPSTSPHAASSDAAKSFSLILKALPTPPGSTASLATDISSPAPTLSAKSAHANATRCGERQVFGPNMNLFFKITVMPRQGQGTEWAVDVLLYGQFVALGRVGVQKDIDVALDGCGARGAPGLVVPDHLQIWRPTGPQDQLQSRLIWCSLSATMSKCGRAFP